MIESNVQNIMKKKKKLIKSYLRSTMSQKRLNGLAILSNEKEMLKKTWI
jgi:hypothetical protein